MSPLGIQCILRFQRPPPGAAGLALALCRAGRLQQRPEWLEAAQQLAGDALSGVASSPQHYKQESLLDGAQHSVLLVLLLCSALCVTNIACSMGGADVLFCKQLSGLMLPQL